jgi:hypothetical protein
MIDEKKYEGHTEGPWRWTGDDITVLGRHTLFYSTDLHCAYLDIHKQANGHLVADAPDLLAEVKRMNRFAHCAMNFMAKHDLHFQFLNEHGVFTAPDSSGISTFIPYSYKWDDETEASSEPIQFNVRGEEE